MKRRGMKLALCLGALISGGFLGTIAGQGERLVLAAEQSTGAYEAGGWTIELEEAERSKTLSSVSVALGYSSVETTDLERSAEEGYEFCLIKLRFEKGDSTEPIQWEKLKLVEQDGTEYGRMDDEFITDYGMQRLPGTDLNFGSYEGWVCYQIPETAGELSLVYSFQEEEFQAPILFVQNPEQENTAAEPGQTEDEEAKTETALWERMDYEDPFTQQRAIDAELSREAQSGYSFEDPFVVLNPYQNSPLSAVVIFSTEEETGVEIRVKGKSEANDVTASFEADDTHILPIYGLYAGETTEVVLTLDDGSTNTLEITTEPLDSVLMEAVVAVDETEGLPDDGMLTFVSVQRADQGSYGAVAYDDAGDIRWILEKTEGRTFALKRLANGHMMMSSSRLLEPNYYVSGLVEFDLCGKYYADYLIPGGQHHDFVELSNGNLLVATDAEDFSTVEDRIVEIDRETGEVVYELDVADLIDPSDGGSVNQTEEDWCHNNSIDYDETTDTLLLSCRHLDAVLGIDKTNKELKWVLGDPSGFTQVPEDKFFTPIHTENGFEWQYAQHQASFLPNGEILLFDNGTSRTKVGREEMAVTGDDVYSRAVCYRIDTDAMTIEQVWSYGKERGREWYSSFISGAEYLGPDDYWITSGGNSYNAEEDTYDLPLSQVSSNELHTYISRVKDGEVVYELQLPSLSFRSTRLPMYAAEDAYTIYDRGIRLGDLGSVETTQMEEADLDAAQPVDFTLDTLVQNPDRIVVSGTWQKTGEDAALLLVDENNEQYAFSIEPASYSSGENEEAFSIWITSSSIPYSHRYRVYLYNQGTLYSTMRYLDNYVDTSNERNGRGPQYTLYETEGNQYTLVTSEEIKIRTGITEETSLPVQTDMIQQEILSELESGEYTIENPLVIQNPYQTAPLTALVAFTTNDGLRTRVTVEGKTEEQDITDTLDLTRTHLVPVLGLYADYENTVHLELLNSRDEVVKENTLTIETDVLPEYLRTAVNVEKAGEPTSMDLMLVSGLSTPYVYAFDSAGEIRWYCSLEREYYGAFPLENGHILIESPDVLYPNSSMPNSPEMLEMDYLGRVFQIYYFPEGVHHEVKEKTPDGNLLVATNSNDGYEQNMVQEIDRNTGEVVKSLNLNELLSELPYITRDDWCHINTVSYDEATDSVLISSRNLHSVIRVNWTTDEIQWILGNPELWEGTVYEDKVLVPTEDFQWHYQQHSAYQLEEDLDGNPETAEIMLFDNHNAQYQMLDSYDSTGHSYVKIYAVNAREGTVSQLANYPTEYSSITSNTFGMWEENRIFSVNAYLPASDGYQGKIYELDAETGEEINTWTISHRFYRAYNVSFDLWDASMPFELSETYRKGTLRTPIQVEQPVRIEGTSVLTEEQAEFILQENILYLYGGDHTYTQIIFNGEDHTYAYDISDIKLRSENVDSYQYRLPIPIQDLEPDTYEIQVMYYDRLYNTNASFTIE